MSHLLAPHALQGEAFYWLVPRVETLGFYEAADFIKTRWKLFLFIFDSFWPTSDNTLTCLTLVL
jgi:hypothetical protein